MTNPKIKNWRTKHLEKKGLKKVNKLSGKIVRGAGEEVREKEMRKWG